MVGIWSRGWPICLQESTKLWQGRHEINFMSNLYHSCQPPLSNHPCYRDDTLDSCSRVKGLKDMLTSGNNRTWIVLYHFRLNYQPANKITRSSPKSKQLTDRKRDGTCTANSNQFVERHDMLAIQHFSMVCYWPIVIGVGERSGVDTPQTVMTTRHHNQYHN